MMLSLRSKLRESIPAGRAYVYFQQLSQRASTKRAVFFPDQMYTGTAGDLRAVAVARELRKMGWRTIVVPPWLDLPTRRKIIHSEPNAVLFLQQSRHPFNNPTLYPDNPCVFDADDADILNNPEQVIACLTGSAAVIAGSEFLAEKFRSYNRNVRVIWTGTYIKRPKGAHSTSGSPTLVWAQGNPFDYPHEADLMLELWTKLAESALQFSVAVYSSEPERVADWLAPLHQLGISHQARPRMRYREFVASLCGAAIGLQPICTTFPYSRGKSFGKVLAYISAGLPVVASDEVDHARFFRNQENGLLVRTLEDWVNACKLLLMQPDLRKRIAETAYEDLGRELSTRAAAEKVRIVLDGVILNRTDGPSSRRPQSV